MAKQVFENSMVAHVWAQQNQDYGRSANRNYWFQGKTLFSYRTPIAAFVDKIDGTRAVMVTSETFSVTTSGKHMPPIWRALRESETSTFRVPFLPSNNWEIAQIHASNVQWLLKGWNHRTDELANTRKRMYGIDGYTEAPKLERRLACLEQQSEGLVAYCLAFGIPVPAFDIQPKEAAIRKAFEKLNDPKLIAKRAKAKEQKELAASKAFERFEAWIETGANPPGKSLFPRRSNEYRELESDSREFTYQYRNEGAITDPAIWNAAKPARVAKAIADRLELERIRNMDAEQKLEAWRNGAALQTWQLSFTFGGPAFLRVKDDMLETSQGARVPLAHAIKAFRFVKLCRESGTAWKRNGHSIRVGQFTVDEISAEGDMTAGCHRILFSEIERVARSIGVYEQAASNEAVTVTA